MSEGCFLLKGVPLKEWGKWGEKEDEDKDRKEEEEEREKKRQKVDEKDEEQKEYGEQKQVDFEEELKAANIEVIYTDALPSIEKQIIEEDNVGMDVDLTANLGSGSAWDCPDKNWVTNDGDDGEWGKPAFTDTAEWNDMARWGETCPGQENPWETSSKSSLLMKLLGPTVLPLTHTTGIVEQSTRRIKSVIPPPPIAAKSSGGNGEGEDPESVEEELERLFAKVVLEPWVGEESSDIRRPVIRASSKGSVVPGSLMEDGTKVEGDPPAGNDAKAVMHDPLTSEITLFVQPSCAEVLSPGMGMLATWVQLVRQKEKPKTESKSGEKKKRKKGKSGSKTKEYWYMEELLVTFPSFYTQEKLVRIV